MFTEMTIDMDIVEKPRGGRTKRTYRCRHCNRLFKRSEHCARHERVHTQERPFPCNFCDRRYARKDLVKRHERSLHAEAYQAAHPEEFRRSSFQLSDHSYPLGDGAPSGQENADSTQSSPSNSTPLTPPIETAFMELSQHTNSCAVDNFFNVDQPLAHDVQSQLGQFSPPASLNELERRASLFGTVVDDSFQSSGYPLRVDFSPIQLWSEPNAHSCHSNMPDMESPTKRRRIEIDPLLLFNDSGQIPQMLPSEVSQHEPFALPPSTEYPLNQDNHIYYRGSKNMLNSETSSLPYCDLYTESALLNGFEGGFQSESVPQFSEQHPHVQKEINFEMPEFKFNEEICQKICEDARSRLPTGELVGGLFPNVDDLNHFFSGYMQCFHRHFPILHLSSLDVRETPSPLIFAICSIGAQYRLARQKAKNLFALAGTMSSYALRAGLPITAGTPKPGPLWIMQTRVLLSLCGMFSGKTNVVMRTVENLGLFAIDYRLRMSLLSLNTNKHLDWEDWIGRESSKRLLCGMFIVSNLISTTFGINPGFSHTQDLEFEVLDEELFWNARSAQEWMELRHARPPPKRNTIRDTMARMIFDEQQGENDQPVHVSGLTMLLIMHAVNIHMWNLLQVVNMSGSTGSTMHDTVLGSAFATLSRCEDIIASVRGGEDYGTWTAAEGPLMFNCQGLLRIAYIRLFSNTSAFDRLTLLTDNPQDIATAVRTFAVSPQKRNQNLMKSVMKAFEMLLETVKIGYLLLRKTAALNWSIEHAIAGWDAALFLTKWVHAIEVESLLVPPNAEESHVLEKLKGLLAEVGSDYKGSGSLAAQVAHFCSTTLNDCWVWGVTPRMGNILQLLAFAYEKDYRDLLSIESEVH
ncbi:hypothetical protein K505DRAFT_355368 [Melanomma pulvis-pyrius CBS 109.77]|uniref:C2H2-type domain-containing protein n=1 Tax=Melanomma pulvis-pyrius CBS 109.77 TaxID=1314802 RepID=A0A6A6XYH9_9PLEO|nr:hypothetical protein K505DRAFT_355368 [Melanomma pulvis-pyrius CBS 109.77]